MSNRRGSARGADDRLDPRLFRELAKAGLRLPQADAEVRAAESYVAGWPGELPSRLQRAPDMGSPYPQGVGTLRRRLEQLAAEPETREREPREPDLDMDR